MTDTFARMRQLNGTTAEWAANDLVIGLGEFAIERITGGAVRLKLGDGIAKFSALPYFDPGIFSYVLKGGDTMSGPLVVPGVTVSAGGLIVSAGNSSFAAPVSLGPNATAADPPASNDTQRVATTHWVNQQVGGIITGLSLKGTWNASTNTPPLASGGGGVPTPERGDFYLVAVSGSTNLDGITTWNAGDSVVFNGFTWQRVPQTLFAEQISAALGYVPADAAVLTTLDGDAIKRQLVDAAGDLIVGSAADTVARLAKGAAGQVLQATAGGLAWADRSGPGEFYGTRTNLAFVTTTAAVCLYDTVTGNAGNFYNPANGRFTPPAGRYHLFASTGWYSSTAAIGAEQVIRKNGATFLYSFSVSSAAGAPTTTHGHCTADANGTDYFDVTLRSSGPTPSGLYPNPPMVFGAFRV